MTSATMVCLQSINGSLPSTRKGFNYLRMFNTLKPRQIGRYFSIDIFKCIFLNENVRISIKIPRQFGPNGPINNIPALVQTIARRWSGDKLFSEPMMVDLLMHIFITLSQWVNAEK